jgi:hypothetical protein
LPIISSTEKELEESITQVNTATTSEQEKESTTESVTSGIPESVTQLNEAVTNGGESTTSESVTKIIAGVIQGQEDQGISTVLQSEGQEILTTPLSIETTQGLESVTSGPSEAVTQLNTAVTSEEEKESTTGLIQTTKETVTSSGEEEKSTTPLSGLCLAFYKLKYI